MIGVDLGDYKRFLRDKKFLVVSPDPKESNLYRVLNTLTLGEYEVWRCYMGRYLQDVTWICKCPHFKERLRNQNKACKHIIAVMCYLQEFERVKKEKVEKCKNIMRLVEEGRCSIA